MYNLGKLIVVKRKGRWYDDCDFLYTYSNTTKQAQDGIENYLASKSVKEEERKKLFSACTPINYYENH